ncbi:MAG: endonuclease VIII, partial [Gammaproteobacteria bacterium]|nr:endonuclease VIII [Gammaproteobacteria bacterium]
TLLQDQQFISGLGNYLCCEILHSCGIHPGKRLIDLDSQQKNYLAGQCLKLTFQSYNTGGITNLITRAKSLRKAGLTFEDFRFLVYRRAGLPCYRCSTVIVKQQYGGKTGYICPICQKL